MKKKRILIFGMSTGYGGVESFIMNYVRNMDREKLSFDFLAYNEPPAYSDEIKALGGKIIIVPGRGKKPLACIKAIKKLLRENKYDAVWSNLCYLSDVLLLKYAKKAGVPIRVVHSHNSVNMSGTLNGLLHKHNRKCIDKYATDFWACSNTAGEFFYTEKIKTSQVYKVIPNAVDTLKFAFDPQMREKKRKELNIKDEFVIGNVGRLHFQKNHQFLLEIFKQIVIEKPNSILLLIGDGELKSQIEAKCIELDIVKNVRLLGRRNDISELMQAMDIFVMPSLFEGLPVVLIEAQSAGLPCVISSTITKEVSQGGKVEYIDLETSPKKWANVILNIEVEKRFSSHVKVKESRYDIFDQAEKITDFFLNE